MSGAINIYRERSRRPFRAVVVLRGPYDAPFPVPGVGFRPDYSILPVVAVALEGKDLAGLPLEV
jgi:hypothetical protein